MDAVAALAGALEVSGLGRAARASGWLYPLSNLLHVLGAALLVGGIAVFDIGVLRRAEAAAAIGRIAIPLAALGLALQIGSGAVLLAAEAVALSRNPAFLAKLGLIALGLLNVALFHRLVGPDRTSGPARTLALVSLASWTLALLAGRAIAYL